MFTDFLFQSSGGLMVSVCRPWQWFWAPSPAQTELISTWTSLVSTHFHKNGYQTVPRGQGRELATPPDMVSPRICEGRTLNGSNSHAVVGMLACQSRDSRVMGSFQGNPKLTWAPILKWVAGTGSGKVKVTWYTLTGLQNSQHHLPLYLTVWEESNNTTNTQNPTAAFDRSHFMHVTTSTDDLTNACKMAAY